jgi:hypothetical protein
LFGTKNALIIDMKLMNGIEILDDYSNVAKHIVDVSEIVEIRCGKSDACCFTISFNDNSCINIIRDFNKSNHTTVLQELISYRRIILSKIDSSKVEKKLS